MAVQSVPPDEIWPAGPGPNRGGRTSVQFGPAGWSLARGQRARSIREHAHERLWRCGSAVVGVLGRVLVHELFGRLCADRDDTAPVGGPANRVGGGWADGSSYNTTTTTTTTGRSTERDADPRVIRCSGRRVRGVGAGLHRRQHVRGTSMWSRSRRVFDECSPTWVDRGDVAAGVNPVIRRTYSFTSLRLAWYSRDGSADRRLVRRKCRARSTSCQGSGRCSVHNHGVGDHRWVSSYRAANQPLAVATRRFRQSCCDSCGVRERPRA